MTTSVIVAIRDAGEAEIAAALASRPGLVVARRCADLVEAVAAATAGVGAVVVMSDQPRLDRAVVRTLVRKGVAIVGVPTSREAVGLLTGLGVPTVLPFPARPDDVVAAAIAAVAESGEALDDDGIDGEGEVTRGALVAVWGPTGAPGRTTVAVNLAVELARLAGSAVLVDADTYGGAVAQAVGILDESPGIAGVARAALRGGSIEEAVGRHAREIGNGLTVLTGVTRPSRWPELSAAALDPMWPVLRSAAAITVVDCGFGIERAVTVGPASGRDDATLSVLSAATVIVVVGSSEPLGIQRLVQALGDLGDVDEAAATPRQVVVNRVRASVVGARPGESIADILARYAAVPETWLIPDDPRTCDSATLVGEPACVRAPRSPFRRAIEALALRVWAEARPPASAGTGATRAKVAAARLGVSRLPRRTLKW